jgi:hypothetical protein
MFFLDRRITWQHKTKYGNEFVSAELKHASVVESFHIIFPITLRNSFGCWIRLEKSAKVSV